MKKLALLPVAALLLAACSESPTAPVADLAPQFSEGNAIHELDTPTDVIATKSGAASISVAWAPELSAVQTQCDAFAAANLENSEVECRGVHFEVYRNGDRVADVTDNTFEDTGLLPGAYSYQIKSKGLEQHSREESFTYHSLMSLTSNVVVFGETCGTPTVTASLTDGDASYTRDNSYVQVTFGGTTTNWNGCPGAVAQYRIVAHNTNNDSVNDEFTTPWADLLPFVTGADYSVEVSIRRHNQNIRYDFEVLVGHDEASGLVSPATTPSVTIVQPVNNNKK